MERMRGLLKLLMQYDLPAELVTIPPLLHQSEPRQRVISNAERAAMMTLATLDMRIHLLLCGDIGLRAGTSAKVCSTMWDRDVGVLRIGGLKHGGSVVLPVTAELEQALKQAERLTPFAPSNVPYVVRARRNYIVGQPLPNADALRSALGQKFQRIAKRLGINNLRPHDLRRTVAEKLYRETGDIRDVKALLGHTNLRSSFHYLERTATQISAATLERIKTA